MNSKQRVCLSVAALAAFQGIASANLIVNPGFESGLAGWTGFGNAFAEVAAPPVVEPYSGNGVAKMFGNFSGGFNVSGIFQEFPAVAGQAWSMDSYSRFSSADPMIGTGPATSNWAVMKLAFFDAGNVEIGNAESVILSGTFAADVWHDNAPINAIAPANTVKVQAFLLYLQPAFDGGAAQFDDVVVTPAPGAAALLGLAGLVASRRKR